MKSPLQRGLLELDEVDSTQNVAAQALDRGDTVGVILARVQTQGRGRFGRTWLTGPDDSLTMSLVFSDYADHPRPYLVGMGVAIACAGALHCQLRWPNDLFLGDKKVGGILTEILPDAQGRRIPVVGVGINLTQQAFPPEIESIATSVVQHRGQTVDRKTLVGGILDRLALLSEPTSWSDLASAWDLFDATPGKRYRLPTGEEAVALGIGPEGQLLCSVNGESTSVMAAEAILGS